MSDGSATEQFAHSNGDGTLAKKTINQNTYVVGHWRDIRKPGYTDMIIVFADEKTGVDDGLPDHPADMYEYEYEEISRHHVPYTSDDPIEEHISSVLNEAICTVEDKQAEEQKYADALDAALRANQEVHGSIDEQL